MTGDNSGPCNVFSEKGNGEVGKFDSLALDIPFELGDAVYTGDAAKGNGESRVPKIGLCPMLCTADFLQSGD